MTIKMSSDNHGFENSTLTGKVRSSSEADLSHDDETPPKKRKRTQASSNAKPVSQLNVFDLTLTNEQITELIKLGTSDNDDNINNDHVYYNYYTYESLINVLFECNLIVQYNIIFDMLYIICQFNGICNWSNIDK